MSLDTFIAGRYKGTYNLPTTSGGTGVAVDVGITDQGYELQQESRWEEVASSDAYGDSIIDGIFRGGNCYIQWTSKAYKLGTYIPFWPWGGAVLGVMQTVGTAPVYPVGRLASDVAGSFILTVVAGTPAAAQAGVLGPQTLTATSSILAPNSSASLLFHTRLRQVPVRFILLPYETTATGVTTTKWFVMA